MATRILERAKYAAYCRDHIADFSYELSEEASQVISGWVGRALVLILLVSTVLTFREAESTGNPQASLTLLAYVMPLSIVMLYPIAINLVSTLERYSALILDLLCVTSVMGFAFTVYVLLDFSEADATQQVLSIQLSGQVSFILLLVTAFSYHASYQATLLKNLTVTFIFGVLLALIGRDFFAVSVLQLVQGFVSGSALSWIFYEGVRARFYSRATDADTREHLHKQLSKLVYPHQLQMIKLGEELELTMPLREGKAIVNVFDVQKSSEIRHEKTQEFFMGVFKSFLDICMSGYEHSPLRSRAFRLKETGDGFISTVGYPFLPTESRSLADSAVGTALSMFDAFNQEVRKFNYSRPIKGAVGLAYNSIQGTFQSGGIRSYDLFGEAIVQAAKYEEMRKQPQIWRRFEQRANELGLEHFHVLIVQEVVYNSLSSSYRDLFVEINLSGPEFTDPPIDMLYDTEARFLYFHVLD